MYETELTTKQILLMWDAFNDAIKEYQGNSHLAVDDPCYIDANFIFKSFLTKLAKTTVATFSDEEVEKRYWEIYNREHKTGLDNNGKPIIEK